MKVVLLLALIGAAMAVPKTVNRIVGGTPTVVNEYPYISNMQFGFLGILWFQSCGGSLITANAVLSAAHCYEGDLPSSWRVRLGTSFASSGGTIFSVSQLIFHPDYVRETIDADVAIVRLSTVAQFSSTIKAARIPGPNFAVQDGTVATAVGWGTLISNGPAPEQLQHVDLNIINQQLCAERYAFLQTQPDFEHWPDITDGMLCSGILNIGGKDTCQGDSGGPLAQDNDIVVGITSWGFSCGDPFYPGVNARVSYYSNWIAANA